MVGRSSCERESAGGAAACVIGIIVTAIIYLCWCVPGDGIARPAELTRRAATRPKRSALCSLSGHRLCLTLATILYLCLRSGTPHISRVYSVIAASMYIMTPAMCCTAPQPRRSTLLGRCCFTDSKSHNSRKWYSALGHHQLTRYKPQKIDKCLLKFSKCFRQWLCIAVGTLSRLK